MSIQPKELKKLQEETHLRLLKTKALILEAQVQIIKMKASALKARMLALKNITLIVHLDFQTGNDIR